MTMMYNDEQNKIDAVSSELVDTQPVQSSVETEAMEKFIKDHFKHIAVGAIVPADKIKIQDVLNFLMTLKTEVDTKIIGSLEKKIL